MALMSTTTVHPVGAHPGPTDTFRARQRGGAVSKGHICTLILDASDDAAVTASTSWGAATDPTSNVVKAAVTSCDATAATIALHCVALEDVADDAEGRYAWRGDLECLVTSGSLAAETALSVVSAGTAGELDTTAATDRIIGILRSPDGSGTAGELHNVLFDGVNGFGIRTA